MLHENEVHFVGKIAQKAAIIKNGMLLMSRDVGQTNFDLPGGRLNIGEAPKAGLAREIQEELGVAIEIGRPFFVDTFIMSRSNEPHLLVVYEAALLEESDFTLESDEIEEVRWIRKDEVASTPMWDEYKRALEVFFNKEN